MLFPTKFRSGDTIEWTLNATTDTYGNPISSPDWSVIYYLRTNLGPLGATVNSSAYNDGFQFTIASNVTEAFVAGDWFYQAVANKSGNEKQTIYTGQFEVLEGLAYSGTPSSFDGRSQLHTWLFRIAYNKAAEHFRRQRHHQSMDAVTEPSSNVLHMERPLMLAQQNQQIIAELARLPFEQRVVVEMKFFQHCTFDDIAQQLGVSANTVKTRLYTALGRMKPQLEVNDG